MRVDEPAPVLAADSAQHPRGRHDHRGELLQTDEEDRAIAQAIIAMDKTLGLIVVAEGVETAEQQTFLSEHDCDEMQGCYFSKPIPCADFEKLLRDHKPTPLA